MIKHIPKRRFIYQTQNQHFTPPIGLLLNISMSTIVLFLRYKYKMTGINGVIKMRFITFKILFMM